MSLVALAPQESPPPIATTSDSVASDNHCGEHRAHNSLLKSTTDQLSNPAPVGGLAARGEDEGVQTESSMIPIKPSAVAVDMDNRWALHVNLNQKRLTYSARAALTSKRFEQIVQKQERERFGNQLSISKF
ncbi:MAG: hypothetical protein LQ347_002057 [Umbilicaria vellea]|nr:MAG: hypothetical protein LQ347_002057 [Umbilicaria vellea]